MTPRPEVRPRAGDTRCDVCWAGPVQAVCSECRRRLCRAHDAILDPTGVLPFGRAARIRQTAWDVAAASAASAAPRVAEDGTSGRVGASRRDDEDDDPGDDGSASPGRSGRTARDVSTAKKRRRDAADDSTRNARKDPRGPEDPDDEPVPGRRNTPRKPRRPAPEEVASWTTLRLPRSVTRALGPEWGTEQEEARSWDEAERQARAEDRHLCPDCVPLDRWWDPELVGAGTTGVLALGAFASSATILAGSLGTVALVRIGTRFVRARIGRCPRRRLRPLAAASPHIRKVRMTETIESRVRLGADQRYEVLETGVRGEVKIDASWTRAGAITAADRVGEAGGDRVTAAHVVLQGPGAFELDLIPEEQVGTGGSVVSLRPRAGGPGHLTGPWPVTIGYAPDADRAGRAVEVWLTPAVGPESDRRTLELDVSWCTYGEERYEAGLALKKLDLVRVVVPVDWGRVEQPSNPEVATIGHDESGGAVVEWKNVRVEPGTLRGLDPHLRKQEEVDQEIDRLTTGRTSGTIRLSLRMACAIPEDASIVARVEARFTGAVSGLTGASVHYGGGGQRPEGRKPATAGPRDARARLAERRDESVSDDEGTSTPTHTPHDNETAAAQRPRPEPSAASTTVGYRNAAPTTLVLLDLDLSLAGLRYQERRRVPDRDEGEDEDATMEFVGTSPDHETVARLVDRLSEGGYYVKRTVENRPQVGRGTSTMTRSWDIGGRYYQGVYPIDFDVLINGDEPTGVGTSRAVTRVKLEVHGTFATSAMRDRVVDEHRNLQQVVAAVLTVPRPSRGPAPDPEDPGEPVSEIRAALRRATRHGRITAVDETTLLRHVDTVFAAPDDR